MKFFTKRADGGPLSNVIGFWLVEIKRLFSIVLLKFGHGSRENYHSHAMNSTSWFVKGKRLIEQNADGSVVEYRPSWKPIITPRDKVHRVFAEGDCWVISFRGPWRKAWYEVDPSTGEIIYLAHSRKRITKEQYDELVR